MKRGRFKPLSVWGGEPDSTLQDENVTDVTDDGLHKNDYNLLIVKGVTDVTDVTEKKHSVLQCVDTTARGEGCASGVYFRPPEYQDITPEQAGMVQCGKCGHSQALGKSEPSGQRVIRCRHANLHGGLWPVLAGEIWRRCAGFTAQTTKGTVGNAL